MPAIALQTQYFNGVRPNLPKLQASEGVASTAQRVGSIALSIIASLVTFATLPWQAAIFVSVAVSSLLLAWGFECCRGDGPELPRVQNAAMPIMLQPMPWYQRAVNWIPFLRRDAVRVADPRAREVVGGGQPFDRRLHDERNPHVRVRARDIPVGGVAVVHPALQRAHNLGGGGFQRLPGGDIDFVPGAMGLRGARPANVEERERVGERDAPPIPQQALGFGAPLPNVQPPLDQRAMRPPGAIAGGVQREIVGRRDEPAVQDRGHLGHALAGFLAGAANALAAPAVPGAQRGQAPVGGVEREAVGRR